MRYSAGHKKQTRARILRAAGKAFRRAGYHATGVDAVMDEAGLTPGGFYAHFPSKEALLAETLSSFATEAGAPRVSSLEGTTGRAWLERFVDGYLSPAHRDAPADGCPLPTLISEVARNGESVKASFETCVRGIAEGIEREAGGVPDGRALALVALCVGGIGLSRSVEDPALADEILNACRALARRALLDDLAPPRKKS